MAGGNVIGKTEELAGEALEPEVCKPVNRTSGDVGHLSKSSAPESPKVSSEENAPEGTGGARSSRFGGSRRSVGPRGATAPRTAGTSEA